MDVFKKNNEPLIQKANFSQTDGIASVNHPHYYGGEDNSYEAIKVIEAWSLNFCLGNVIKYISRAGKKNKEHEIQDLEKALWYLKRELATKNKNDEKI